MTTLRCPVCREGEVEVKIDSAPKTHFYPGHQDVEILSSSCDCDLEKYIGDLFVDAAEAEGTREEVE